MLKSRANIVAKHEALQNGEDSTKPLHTLSLLFQADCSHKDSFWLTKLDSWFYPVPILQNPHNFLCTQTEICIMTFQGYVFLFTLSLGLYYIDY